MTKRIYLNNDEEDATETCEVGPDLLPRFRGECEEDATYLIEDKDTGIRWLVCYNHKEQIKAAGVAW